MRYLPIVLALALLAGCGGGGGNESGNAAAGGGSGVGGTGGGPSSGGNGVPQTAVETAGLTGLYEGGAGPRKSQLCVIDKGTGDARFGINVWGANMHSCSGAGTAVRSGERLTLTMAGDSSCRIDASMRGGTVTLPATLPQGCEYYCGKEARFAGVTLARTGTTAADALKARDVADDPLCDS
jgi:hypothetical protein